MGAIEMDHLGRSTNSASRSKGECPEIQTTVTGEDCEHWIISYDFTVMTLMIPLSSNTFCVCGLISNCVLYT